MVVAFYFLTRSRLYICKYLDRRMSEPIENKRNFFYTKSLGVVIFRQSKRDGKDGPVDHSRPARLDEHTCIQIDPVRGDVHPSHGLSDRHT